jgi:hypothetical protein
MSTTFNQSSLFSGITWDYGGANRVPDASGSDLWAPTWADDGNLYTSWGDGGGFGGTDELGRVQFGFARVEGATYNARSAYNVYGGNNPESDEPAWNPSSGNVKNDALVCVNSVLYGCQVDWAVAANYIKWRFIHSHDKAAMWRMSNQASLDNDTWEVSSAKMDGPVGHPIWFQMGQNHQSTPNSGHAFAWWPSSLTLFRLARVPITGIMSMSEYKFRTASGTYVNSPDAAETLFESASSGTLGDVRAWYLPTWDRYFTSFSIPYGTSNWILLDAPNPWGPWTKVGQWTDWIEGGSLKFGFQIVDKWVSSGSNDFHMIYSGANFYDNFCSIKGTFNLQSEPGSYSVSSWSTYAGSQSWVKEVDGADIADATVSHLAIFDQVVAGQIAAGAIGAAEIAAGTIVASHIVVGGINGATIISSGTITTDQVGTNELIAHTANIKDAMVTTLKIGLNQVTVPVSDYSSGVASLFLGISSKMVLCSVPITTMGQPVSISLGIFGDQGDMTFQVYRDTAFIISLPGNPNAYGYQTIGFTWPDNPSSGSHTYYIYGYWNGTGGQRVYDRSLLLLETRR